MKKNRGELDLNEMQITLLAFLESYNKNMPPSFPRASATVLKKFQEAHPMLFKQSELWSVARHRKRFMDWFSSHSDIT
jgi:hypothetical protein